MEVCVCGGGRGGAAPSYCLMALWNRGGSPRPDPPFGRAKKGLHAGWSFGPLKEGGGNKGALVTGQSKEASLKTVMVTHHLHRKAAGRMFSSKTISLLVHTSK